MDQAAVAQGWLVKFCFPQLVGLEIIVERIQNSDLALEIDVQKILVQIHYLSAHFGEGAVDFAEVVIGPEGIQVEERHTGIAVDLGGEIGADGSLLGLGHVAADLAAHGYEGDLGVE